MNANKVVEDESGLDKAIEYFGSPSALAKKLGVSPMSISHWRRRGVPLKRAIEIEFFTKGFVPKESLSDDFEKFAIDKTS